MRISITKDTVRKFAGPVLVAFLILLIALLIIRTKEQREISARYEVEKFALTVEAKKADRLIASLRDEVKALNKDLDRAYSEAREAKSSFQNAEANYEKAKKEKALAIKEAEKKKEPLWLCDTALKACKFELSAVNLIAEKEKDRADTLVKIDAERSVALSLESAKVKSCEEALSSCYDALKAKRVSSFWKKALKVGTFVLGAAAGYGIGKALK